MHVFEEIRRLTIIALFADEELMKQLVLKGGNALNIAYGISPRTSLDVDFSLENDFENFSDAKERIFSSLKDRFDSAGYVVFDEKLERKPELDGEDARPWWGGYQLLFKVIKKEDHARLKHDERKMQLDSLVIGPNQQRVFSADISKCEYTSGKKQYELDHYKIYIYTPAMVAIEKLRALCQQLPEYEIKGGRSARARDFYDIHLVLSREGIDLTTSENVELIRNIFAAKHVPLSFLAQIGNQREFHRPDWPSVKQAIFGPVEDFDYYFDFVVNEVQRLQALWNE